MTNGVIYCSRCGAPNSALAKFCSNCGTPFTAEVSPPNPTEVIPRAQGPAEVPPVPPPIAPSSTAQTSWAAPQPGVRYAGFWIRFLAFIIDFLILGIIVWPLAAIIAALIGVAGGAVMMPTMGVHLVRGVVAARSTYAWAGSMNPCWRVRRNRRLWARWRWG